MPISIQDFERGEAPDPGESEDSFEAKAQKLLQAHREQAFTLEEIVRGAGFLAPDAKSITELLEHDRYQTKLQYMAHQGRIRQNEVQRGKYVDVFWAAK